MYGAMVSQRAYEKFGHALICEWLNMRTGRTDYWIVWNISPGKKPPRKTR